MTAQNKGRWQTIITVSIGPSLGVGVFTWTTQLPPLPEPQAHADSQHDQRLVKLEQAVTALTQAVHSSQTKTAQPESTRVTAPANDEYSDPGDQ